MSASKEYIPRSYDGDVHFARISEALSPFASGISMEDLPPATFKIADFGAHALLENIPVFEYDAPRATGTFQSSEAPKPRQRKVDSMSDMNRDEVKARLEASEARVEAVVVGIRADNDRMVSKLEDAARRMETAGEISRHEMASFREEMLRRSVETQYAVTKEVHQMKAWILTGALTGAIALLGMLVKPYFDSPGKPSAATQPGAAQSQPQVVFQLPQIPAQVSSPQVEANPQRPNNPPSPQPPKHQQPKQK